MKYGCWNPNPRFSSVQEQKTYRVQNGWTEDGRRIMEKVPSSDSIYECKYDNRKQDERCNGCFETKQ